MTQAWRPTVENVIDLEKRLDGEIYNKLWDRFEQEQKFYECDFLDRLNLPKQFASEGIVLPTGRDFVDTYVDHLDLTNARITVNKYGSTQAAFERQQLMERFFSGLLYLTNVFSDISPWRVAGKHHGIHGVAILKTVYDADRWMDKPERDEEKESEAEYAEKLDDWRAQSHTSLPIVIQAVNPRCIMPDPSYGGKMFIIEKHDRLVLDMTAKYRHWSNPKGKKLDEKATYISFWTPKYRCDLVDGEPVLQVKGGVAKHNYGFIPYTIIEAGLGNISYDAKPEMRYVGILRYIFDLLVSESRNYSISDVVLKRTAWPWGYLKGENAKEVTNIDQSFGTYNPLPEGVEIVQMSPQLPPDALNAHLFRTSAKLEEHAAPRAVRGLSEPGVRSEAHRRGLAAEAGAKYRYSTEAFKNGAAQVLIKCAYVMKNIIPGDIRIWAKTPVDEFDVEVKKEDMKEPFTCSVEFAPIAEELEYRRHDDLERLYKTGIITKRWARSQMSNIDPIDMEIEEETEKLLNDPNLQQLATQYAGGKLAAAIAQRTGAENIKTPVATVAPGAPTRGGVPPELGRRLVAPSPQRAIPGSAEDLQNQMKAARSRTPLFPGQGEGIGAGGFRP